MLRALLVCCCFLACAVSAKVQRLSPNEGLSQSYVSNMLIDKYGYLWLGTESGLNRYDGYQVIAVAGDNGELDEAMIDALYQDQQGHIWIASLLAGLHRFDPDTGRTEQVLGPPQNDDVTFAKAVFTMLAIGPNELWLGRGEDVASLNIETGEVTSLFTLESEHERSLVRQCSNSASRSISVLARVPISMICRLRKSVLWHTFLQASVVFTVIM